MAKAATPASGRRATTTREQSRARYPDETGFIERAGVRVFWERYGDGAPTILLMPTWSIIHSRHWKAQIPYLARQFRVVTFDGRGNGRSDRPAWTEAYDDTEFVADAIAVLEASRTEGPAVLAGISNGAHYAIRVAAEHPASVLGLVLIGSSAPIWDREPDEPAQGHDPSFTEPQPTDEGWAKYNAPYWRRDWAGFAAWFVGETVFTEPHSTKQIEDAVGWMAETDPETIIRTETAKFGQAPAAWGGQPPTEPLAIPFIRRVRCPALVIHGEDDHIIGLHHAERLAAELGAPLFRVGGGGHDPAARDPVRVNVAIRDFVSEPGVQAVSVEAPDLATRFDRDSGRARLPDHAGLAIAEDGIRLAFEVYGDGAPTIVLLPSAPIVHSRQWKAQIPYLARHFRVVAFDGRGNGRSDRPTDPLAYLDDRMTSDIATVLAATGTTSAVLVGLCADGVWRAIRLAAEQPDRVLGIVAFAVGVPRLSPPHPYRVEHPFDEPRPAYEGWAKVNRHYWQEHYPDFAAFFFSAITSEPHSTKAIDDAIGWALDGSVDAMLAEAETPFDTDLATIEATCRAVRCPMLLVHGTADHCQPVSRAHRLRELTGAPLVIVDGADHMIPGRHPVLANRLIRDFVRSLEANAS